MKSIGHGARARVESCMEQQVRSITAIQRGTPWAAEPNPQRLRERVSSEARLSPVPSQVVPTTSRLNPLASEVVSIIAPFAEALPNGAEAVWGPTSDFVGVAFLERGVNAARTVGRVAFRDGRAQGTGFLIAPGLFITNHHVVESAADCGAFFVEFDYEIDISGRPRTVSRFELDPASFFITDDRDDLDYSIIALGRRLDGSSAIETFGFSPLSGATNKHTLGELANIVQHPDGRLKEVVLRENKLVSRLSHVLHYVADTQPGSSGSPVFNNQWQAIALHHWGGPWRQDRDADGRPVSQYVNEGIRISAIVDELRSRRGELGSSQRRRLDEAIALGESTAGIAVPTPANTPSQTSDIVQIRQDGTAVWRVPIEISIGIPGLGAQTQAAATDVKQPAHTLNGASPEAFRRKLDTDYENRKGYRPRFLSGFEIDLPKVGADRVQRLARNRAASAGDDPHELPYEHFSVYLDRVRGLPMMTACNIDGKNLKSIDRDTGAVSDAESLSEELGPEARETWYIDPRIDPRDCGDDALYTDQQVSAGSNRNNRIFHRGHMVRRLDPCWGSTKSALRAEADTFHFTNCTPQVGTFNSSQSLWQGIENHILDNARVEDRRVTVFTGPVLEGNDPAYRQNVFPGFRVPLRFWKIAVWQDDDRLAALALIADQSPVLREMPEGGGERIAPEDLGDTDDVENFVTTVTAIERMTGLDFGAAVREADLFEEVEPEGAERMPGSRLRRLRSFADLNLSRRSGRISREARRPKGKKAAKGEGSKRKAPVEV